MNILFIVDVVPYPPNTGHKIRTFNIIKQLYNYDENNVYLLCFNQKALVKTQEELTDYVNALRKYCKEVHVFDIPTDKNKYLYYKCLLKNLFQLRPYRAERYRSVECEKAIQRIMGVENIDLVHLDKTELYGYSRLFGDVPIVCTNHNVESELMRRRSRREINLPRKIFAYLQYLKTRVYERRVLNKMAGYITCTDRDKEYFQRQLGVTASQATIDNGVDVSHYNVSGSGGSYILIIGAQNKESTANYDATRFFMSEIWPVITQRYPDLELKIVGRDPDVSIVAYQDNWKNVEVCGFASDERPYLGDASALIVPLRVGGGSRLKILTAMAMGKVVVSTSIGAEGISCEDGINILIADEPESFASKVCDMLSDSELSGRIGSGARDLVERKYDWNMIGRRLRDYYLEVIRRD